MKSLLLTAAAGLASLGLVSAATSTTEAVPSSTDASSYLKDALSSTPTWATGKYVTSLATALYSVETSFVGRDDYTSIINAIWSAASKDGGDEVVASLSASYWNWGDITTDGWYTSNVPKALQTEVLEYDSAWESAITKVEAKATATGNAAAPRCTGMAVAGAALAGVAAVAGVL